MKKLAFLLIISLFVLSPSCSQADEVLSFEDFCPYKACQNLDVSKKYYSASKKYWVQRKIDFETKKANCEKIADVNEQKECYQKLKNEENELTNAYIASNSASSYSSYSNNTTIQSQNALYNYNNTYNNHTYNSMNNTYKPLNNYGSSSYGSNPVRMQPSYSYTNNSFNTWKPTSGHYGYGKW